MLPKEKWRAFIKQVKQVKQVRLNIIKTFKNPIESIDDQIQETPKNRQWIHPNLVSSRSWSHHYIGIYISVE
jgi:hypothetical protein